MIQAFQKFSQSRPAKIFLAIVALSFMVFFGGSQWFRSPHPHETVAEVGPLSIGYVQFLEKLNQRIHEIIAQTEGKVTRDALLQTGLPQLVLNQLIQETLLDLEAKHLGLTISDKAIKKHIHTIAAFQNSKGVFDRALFNQVLRANNLTEDAFITTLQQELIREQLINAITVGAFLPEGMIDQLFEAQYQYRQASMVIVSPQEMPRPPLPSEKELEDFYKTHKKAFTQPELRTLSVLLLDPSALTQDIRVTDEEIQALYDAKPEAFGGKSLKEVRPLIIKDIQKEKASELLYTLSQDLDDKIAAGSTLEELAKAEKKTTLLKLELVDAKGLTKAHTPSPALPKDEGLAQDVLQTGFGLESGTDTPFSQAQNGVYYMVRVDALTPSTLPPFKSILAEVKQAWTLQAQFKEARAKAESYVDSFNRGDKKLSLMMLLPTVSLSVPSPSLDQKVKDLVCSLPLHHAGMVLTPKGFVVVVLNKIIPPTADVRRKNIDSFKRNLLDQYKEDLLMAYLNALHIRYPVKVNQAALQALLAVRE